MRLLLLVILFTLSSVAQGQQAKQSIRGVVIERDSRKAIAGATVTVELQTSHSAIADTSGKFIIEHVPTGRIRLRCSHVGYQELITDDIILSSAKEPEIEIEMEEAKSVVEGVVVRTSRFPKQPLNRYILASGRSFSPEETQRYSASVNDPSRMAVAFPGVQATRDTRSDIIIRGNNPVGMQWRLEGVDIMNPNHFARKGSTGGGITILSLSMLDQSDFTTGGMPAEYGDVLSGVFDMRLRKGNRQNAEHTFKAGMIGLDFATEGPLTKDRSSYLVNYRYSTLGLLQTVGLNLVGERESNTFQDLSFNVAFSNKRNSSHWNVWGMGGLSDEDYAAIENPVDWKQYDDYAIYEFKTRMGAMGIGHILSLSEKAFLKSSLVAMGQQITFVDDTLNKQKLASTVNDERYDNRRFSFTTSYNLKFSASANMKAGIYVSDILYKLRRDKMNYQTNSLETVTNAEGSTWLIQPYVQMSLKTKKWTFNPGVHVMYLSLNSKTAVDPRLSVQYKIDVRSVLTFSYGLYSKTVPLGSYFFMNNGNPLPPNKNLDMMRSHHYIAGLDHQPGKSWRVRLEGYFQRLIDIPVLNSPQSTYWLLNEIEGYAKTPLVSSGKGVNKGIDISVEKVFIKGFFTIASFSVFDSKYQPLNGNSYNTRFNANTAGAWTGAKEWKLKNNRVLQAGWKTVYNGGFRVSPLSSAPVINTREPTLDESKPFSEKVSPYFRTDGRIAVRKDKPKGVSWQLALDIQNIFGLKNTDALFRRYDPSVNQWIYDIQSGIVPVLSYQVDF